ncbi:MAG: ATP-dependent helicase, partial [Planctomycetes bacterium]|nr:ATP-dependent helicase [Planctomycetota bacterium]
PDRQSLEAKFRRGELKQLVNVDIFGEGYDLPALEVCSMARPTASYALYCQQFGRPLRTMAGKSYGTVIDHVGNVVRHSTVGLPDARIEWSMERRDKRASSGPSDIIPVKSCVNCTQIYEAFHRCCPHCGFVTVPESRSAPKYVDGDLLELSPEVLEAMRAEVARIDEDPARLEMRVARAAGGRAAGSVVKHHRKRQETQTILRMVISDWADRQRAAGLSDPDSYRKFWYLFGVDVMTAQALNIKEAQRLTERIVKNS